MSMKDEGIKARPKLFGTVLVRTRVHTVMRLPKDRGGVLVLVVQRRLIGPLAEERALFSIIELTPLVRFCLVSAEYAGFIP